MIPTVRVWSSPKGLPMASTRWPTLSSFELKDDEYLSSIVGKYGGETLVSIKFLASSGRTSPVFGGSSGGTDYQYESPAGSQIAGIFGRAGSAIAFAMDCYEQGLLSEKDIGFPLKWGDAEAIHGEGDVLFAE